MDLTFVHRSLQEYFAASFVLRAPIRQRRELLALICRDRLPFDEVASLVFDMDQVLFEDEFLLDELSRLREFTAYEPGMPWNHALANFMDGKNRRFCIGSVSGLALTSGPTGGPWDRRFDDLLQFVMTKYGGPTEAVDYGHRRSLYALVQTLPDTGPALGKYSLRAIANDDLRREDVAHALSGSERFVVPRFRTALMLPDQIATRRDKHVVAIYSDLIKPAQ